MKHLKKYRYFYFTLLLLLLIIGITFSLENIYPFGKNVYNIIDFDLAYVPVYYKLWDILHGTSSILFDWNLGMGLSCFGSLIMNGLIVPTSWLIALFPRSFIPYAMSYILIIKIFTIAICTYIALHKLFPNIKDQYKMIFTLIYTLSGWTLLMASSILYLDAVALFPLFLYSLKRLLKDNKWGMYVIILTLVLMISYYMAWMYLFFIIGFTMITILTRQIPNKKEKSIKVLLLTLLSLGLSCILFLPAFGSILSSYRLSNGFNGNDTGFQLFADKLIYILPLGMLFTLTFKNIQNSDKKKKVWIILLLIYTLIGIFVEPINLLWHTGSYSNLPFRYAYIPTFMLILFSLDYLNQNNLKEYAKNKITLFSTVILLIIFTTMAFTFKSEMEIGQIALHVTRYSQIICPLFLFILTIIITIIIFKNNKKYQSTLLVVFSILVITSFSYLYTSNKGETSSALYTNQVKEEFNLVNDYGYVDLTNNLNRNFPYILKVPSMENVLHFIRTEEINFRNNLGYIGNSTAINSEGGTLFSNFLLSNKYYISKNKLNSELYTLIDQKNGLYYYEANFIKDLVIPYSGNIYNLESDNIFDNTNQLYQELFNKNDCILEIDNYQETIDNYEFNIKPGNIYYLMIQKDATNESINIDANIENNINDYYDFQYLSFDTDEEKTIYLNKNQYKIIDIQIGHINITKFKSFINSIEPLESTATINKSTKTYYLNSQIDTSILLPINYNDNFKITVNGKNVDYTLNAYNMLSIDILKGENEIIISMTPKYLKEGFMISISSFILLIVILLINKKFNFLKNKIILNSLFIITCIIGILFILKVYILSWI